MREQPGIVVLEIDGSGSRALLDEAGGHRVQRIPSNERRGRVHTSTVTVAVLEAGEVALHFPDSDFRVEWFSGTGKGGQHRNKHQNSARVIHLPTGFSQSRQGRHRESNLREARQALEELLVSTGQVSLAAEENGVRSGQVGSGMRGDKRRTYRFQDDRVVDHVSGRSARTTDVMKGRFDLLWR